MEAGLLVRCWRGMEKATKDKAVLSDTDVGGRILLIFVIRRRLLNIVEIAIRASDEANTVEIRPALAVSEISDSIA